MRLNSKCGNDVMSFLTLAKLHNLTFSVHTYTVELYKMLEGHIIYSGVEQIAADKFFTTSNLLKSGKS